MYREYIGQKNCKERIRVLKHIESLNGDYNHYIKNAEKDDIDILTSCCQRFLTGDYKFKKKDRLVVELLSKPIRKDVKKLCDPKMPTLEKRELLSNPQKGDGIFTLLVGAVLPALISLLNR